MKLRIGTRGSELALWQAHHIAGLIGRDKTEIVIIKTKGDQIQNVSFDKMEGKGFFTKEIEDALLAGAVDLAVHSLKDLTTEDVPGLELAAVPERAPVNDVLLIRRECSDPSRPLHLAPGTVVGTSSMRRLAQLKFTDSSLKVEALRGNVPTRVGKLAKSMYGAIVIARAGIERLGIDTSEFHEYILPVDIFLPAPAQGALGLQIRSDDVKARDMIHGLNHAHTETVVRTERFFLKHFGGGCHIPLGAYGELRDGIITLTGLVAAPDGSGMIRETVTGTDPEEIGARLAKIIKGKGAEAYL